MQRPVGAILDDPDELFNWLHNVVVGVPVLRLACQSGLAARLAQGPATQEELAQASGIEEGKLARLLDYMQAHELLARDANDMVIGNARLERAGQLAGLWQQVGNTMTAGQALLPALQNGKTGFEEHFGKPVFEHFAANPDMGGLFAEFMSFMTSRTIHFIRSSHRFHPFERLVDLGGSHGALLLPLLEEYSEAKGVLFDLPGTVRQAEQVIAASPLADRVEIVGGSFFESVPTGDLYTLKQILHDWDDGECVAILSTIREAILPGGRVAVIDHLLSETPRPDEAQSTDIAMMIWATGRERRQADFEALFDAAGFRLDRVSRNPRGHSVIEAVPV